MNEDFIQAELHPMYAEWYFEDREREDEEQTEWEAEMAFERERENNY